MAKFSDVFLPKPPQILPLVLGAYSSGRICVLSLHNVQNGVDDRLGHLEVYVVVTQHSLHFVRAAGEELEELLLVLELAGFAVAVEVVDVVVAGLVDVLAVVRSLHVC